ncbi:hypothetical protein [Streptomyces tendae]|uniref:hypothetical protein n=1 Tax=Streptomyces tendae TaxID=1932 RepID=UPI003D74DE61
MVGARTRRQQRAEETIRAELVVDAAGRGSRASTWLRESGYPASEQTVIKTDVAHATRHDKQETGLLDGRLGATVVPFPGSPELASTLQSRTLQRRSGSGTPVDEAVRMRHPISTLQPFDRVERSLDGFLVMGDALCSFNPTYGQGMAVEVMEAELLLSLLEGRDDLSVRFFTAAAALPTEPWSLAAGGDLRFPEADGEGGPQEEEINRYLDCFRAATAIDPVLSVHPSCEWPTRWRHLRPCSALRCWSGLKGPHAR